MDVPEIPETTSTGSLSGVTATGRLTGARTALAVTSMSTMGEQVAAVIETLRPIIQADNGDITLRGVNSMTGMVTVEFLGAAGSCPASARELNDGVERFMKSRVEGVTGVRRVGADVADGSAVETETLVSL